jgi:hypothetical protein
MHSIIELSSITVYIMKKLVGKSRNIEPQWGNVVKFLKL